MALDQISQSQSQKEVTANADIYALGPSSLFGRRASGCVGLTWAYYGGPFRISGVPTLIADGTIALTDNATNYLYATSSGVVTKTTTFNSAWPGPIVTGAMALYELTTSGGFVVAGSIIDWRACYGS